MISPCPSDGPRLHHGPIASSRDRDIGAVTAAGNAALLHCHHERVGENALRPLRSGRTPRTRRRWTAFRASPVPAFRKSSSWMSPIKSTAPDGAHRHRGTCNCDALEVRSRVQSLTLRERWRPLSTAFRAFREPAFRKSSSWNAPMPQGKTPDGTIHPTLVKLESSNRCEIAKC